MKSSVLLVDDDHALRTLLREQLESLSYEVHEASDATEALDCLASREIDAVVTDLRMPGPSGTDLCREVVTKYPLIPVTIMTAFGDLDGAITAIRAGAYDFLTKPFEVERLQLTLERALTDSELRGEVRRLRRQTGSNPGYDSMIGTSAPMQKLYDVVDRVAQSEASVLILGESGSGKELVARSLHTHSRRRRGPFVAINCAAMPEQLIESELFGHERGAFTDAKTARSGLLRDATGGTVFLDEIGDLSAALQPKLLRALQERRIRPVGGDREVEIDVRILAATHHDLRADVDSGRFRADLYYRLNVITLPVPPLRDRGDDVLLLAESFLEEFSKRDGRPIPAMADGVEARLRNYGWPGNVRELYNCIERCVALSSGESIEVEALPPELVAKVDGPASEPAETPGLRTLFDIERRHILRVLQAVGGNKSKAARILEIDRKTLHARLLRYGLS